MTLGGELGADRAAVGVLDLIEDAQRVRPRAAGGGVVARAVVDIAEAVKGLGLAVAVGEFAVEINGPLVAREGLAEVAGLVANIAEAVPDGRLPVARPKLLDRGKRPLAVAECPFVAAEQGMGVADVVECPGL